MNDTEKVAVLKGALEQLVNEVQHLLSRFKEQVTLENEQTETDPDVLRQQHLVVCQSIQTEWALIRTLYLLLSSNTREVNSYDPLETLQPIESLLEKLQEGQHPFKHHEFQFPFHLSSLVSSIKTSVRNYILQFAPKEVDNCDLFTPKVVKSPKKTPVETSANPIVTNNVRQAAKKFEQITETIAESSKLKKGQTTMKRAVTRVTKTLDTSPVKEEPPKTASNANDEEKHSVSITIDSDTPSLGFQKSKNVKESHTHSNNVQSNDIGTRDYMNMKRDTHREGGFSQETKVVDANTAAGKIDYRIHATDQPNPAIEVHKDPKNEQVSKEQNTTSESLSRSNSKKVYISDKSLAFVPSQSGMVKSTSTRSFKNSDSDLQREHTIVKPAKQHEADISGETNGMKVDVSLKTLSTGAPSPADQPTTFIAKNRTPVSEKDVDNPFRSSTQSKTLERNNSNNSISEASASPKGTRIKAFAKPVKETIPIFTKDTSSYANTIQQLKPQSPLSRNGTINKGSEPSSAAGGPSNVKKSTEPSIPSESPAKKNAINSNVQEPNLPVNNAKEKLQQYTSARETPGPVESVDTTPIPIKPATRKPSTSSTAPVLPKKLSRKVTSFAEDATAHETTSPFESEDMSPSPTKPATRKPSTSSPAPVLPKKLSKKVTSFVEQIGVSENQGLQESADINPTPSTPPTRKPSTTSANQGLQESADINPTPSTPPTRKPSTTSAAPVLPKKKSQKATAVIEEPDNQSKNENTMDDVRMDKHGHTKNMSNSPETAQKMDMDTFTPISAIPSRLESDARKVSVDTTGSSFFDYYSNNDEDDGYSGIRKSSIQTITRVYLDGGNLDQRDRSGSNASIQTITKPYPPSKINRAQAIAKQSVVEEETTQDGLNLSQDCIDLANVPEIPKVPEQDAKLISKENLLLFGRSDRYDLESKENLLKDSEEQLSSPSGKRVSFEDLELGRSTFQHGGKEDGTMRQQEKQTEFESVSPEQSPYKNMIDTDFNTNMRRQSELSPGPSPVEKGTGIVTSPSLASVSSRTSTTSNAPAVNKSTKPTRKPSIVSNTLDTTQQMMQLKRITMHVAKRRQDMESVVVSEKDYILGLMSSYGDDKNDITKSSSIDSDLNTIKSRKVSTDIEQKKMDMLSEIEEILSSVAADPPPLTITSPTMKAQHNFSSTPTTPHKRIESNEVVESPKQKPISEAESPSRSKTLFTASKQATKKSKASEVSEVQTFHLKSKVFDPTSSAAAYIDDKEQTTISTARLMQYKTRSKQLQVLMVPLNGMFDMRLIELSQPHRFGRNNTTNHPCFKAFGTLVVSRNHLELFPKDGKVYIKDIGSNSGTFRNNARLSQPGQPSIDVELLTGDYVQLGKDFAQGEDNLDEYGRIQARKRCVRFQVVIVQPGQTVLEAVQSQTIPIEKPVNRSDIPASKKGDLENKEEDEGQAEGGDNQSEKNSLPQPEQLPPLPNDAELKKQTSASGIPPPLTIPLSHQRSLKHSGLPSASEHSATSPLPYFSPRSHTNEKNHFILSYTLGSTKLTKLQLNHVNNTVVLEVHLKKWEEKCRLTVQDHRDNNDSFDVFLETKPGAKSPTKIKAFTQMPWQVMKQNGRSLGHLVFASDMRLEVNPIDSQSDASIAITGDFKQQRFICVKKSAQTREQLLLGESKGRHQSKKALFESSYLANLDIIDTECTTLVLAGALLSIVLYGN